MIHVNFHNQNRQALSSELHGGLFIISAYHRMQRGNDAAFFFEQEANFWYLTGIDEPEWMVIIDGSTGEECLIAPDVSEVHRVFDGSLSSIEATQLSGIKKVVTYDEGMALLRRLAKKHSVVYTLTHPEWMKHTNFVPNPSVVATKKILERTFAKVQDCRKELNRLRAIKQPEEVTQIKKAIQITTQAFAVVKSDFKSYKYEYQVQAEFDYAFRQNNTIHGYDPIVGAGKNAVTLHYQANSDRIKSSDLVLMDIGARFNHYNADISRTYATGAISKRKQMIHAAVQSAHYEIISLIRPGVSLESYQHDSDVIMKKTLIELGLLQREDDNETYRTYFPHAISHGLGIDVHDSLGGYREFMPGMVLTVEPGVYIPEESIGVRLEDNILVTEKGNTNLSKTLSTDY